MTSEANAPTPDAQFSGSGTDAVPIGARTSSLPFEVTVGTAAAGATVSGPVVFVSVATARLSGELA
jgi:hypothetical protein